MSLPIVLLCPVALAAAGASWPRPLESGDPEHNLNIDVRLAPPARPLPQVAAEVDLLESARKQSEQEGMRAVEAAYSNALESAKAEIAALVGKSTRDLSNLAIARMRAGSPATRSRVQAAFLQRSEHQGAAAADQPSVRVSVVPAPPPDPSLKVKMDDIEQRRSKAEGLLFEQAAAEMKDLTRVVLAELQAQLQMHMDVALPSASARQDARSSAAEAAAFPGSAAGSGLRAGEGLPKQVNVRVGSSELGYPTVSSFVQDMESRRDASERLARERILEAQMKLVTAENAVIKQALHGAVGRFMAEHATLSSRLRK